MDQDQNENFPLTTSSPAPHAMPTAGGSYTRQADGSLLRVSGTTPAPDRAATEPGIAGETQQSE